MLFIKIQPQSSLGSGEDFYVFLPYMGMVAILFTTERPFEQIVSTMLTEGPMWNLVKIGKWFQRRKHLKIYTILYMYKAQRQGQIPQWDKILIVTNKFYYFNHTL